MRDAAFNCAVAIFLWLFIDFFGAGILFRLVQDMRVEDIEKRYRIKNPVYHHELKRNFRGVGFWGNREYEICTNDYGMKASCDRREEPQPRSGYFDIGFIGDSATEGIGLPYEDTFVGMIANSLGKLRIANLGASSYSPSIYYHKVKYLIEHGVNFGEIVVYVDVSDIHDEAVVYESDDETVWKRNGSIEDNFRITHMILQRFELLGLDTGVALKRPPWDSVRSEWTYYDRSPFYGPSGVEGGIEKSLRALEDMYEYLSRRGISLSIAVYPWPAQLKYDREESRQVEIWRNFCKSRCRRFYNSFPSFFSRMKSRSFEDVYRDYFIDGDIHYNEKGNRILADDFMREYSTNARPDP